MILWEGASLIDGAPIVVIATSGTKNAKTGPMLQTWILRSDVAPNAAARDGSDASICGHCPHRYRVDPVSGLGSRTCYVRSGEAPLSVWRKYRRRGMSGSGAFARMAGSAYPSGGRIGGTPVRIGSYGDPGAVPLYVWERLLQGAPSHTGYTHRWRERPDLRGICMASVDSEAEMREARLLGWRTFRVLPVTESVTASATEIECRSESDGATCADCRLCSGSTREIGAIPAISIAILAHGASRKRVGLPIVTDSGTAIRI